MCSEWQGRLVVGATRIPTSLARTQKSAGIQHAQVWNPGSGSMKTLLPFTSLQRMKELALQSSHFAPFTGRCSTRQAL